MCRLAMLNRQGIEYAEQNHKGGITALFDCLENSYGGHGNGAAIIYQNKKIEIIKGVCLTNDEIAEKILGDIKRIEHVIYHTRLASMGNVSDKNCHPFRRNKNVLAMNGTENWIRPLVTKNETDTETILKMVTASNKNLVEVCKGLNSVFLGMYQGKMFATHGKGDLELLQTGTAKIFASEFPKTWYNKTKIIEAPKVWVEGQKVKTKRKVRKTAKQKDKYFYLPVKYRYVIDEEIGKYL